MSKRRNQWWVITCLRCQRVLALLRYEPLSVKKLDSISKTLGKEGSLSGPKSFGLADGILLCECGETP